MSDEPATKRWYERARELGWDENVVAHTTDWVKEGWKVVLVTENVVAIQCPYDPAHLLITVRIDNLSGTARAREDVDQWRDTHIAKKSPTIPET
jgi:hypothetical protein